MKKLILSLTICATALLSHSAFADRGNTGRGYGGYSPSYSGRYDSGRYGYGNGRSNYYNTRWNSGRRYGGGYSGSYFGISYNSGRGYYGNRQYGGYRNNWRFDRRYDRNYGRNYRGYYGGFYNRRYNRHYDGGDFLGGLVVGSLLSNTISRSYDSPPRVTRVSRPVVRSREVVVVREPSTRSAPVASGRRLLKDLEGRCFERVLDESGDEIRIELDPSECSF